MYIPVNLTLKNLLSHKDTSWEFKHGMAVMILGENLDDDGQESNGSGKSAIIEAISLCLTGSPFRKIKDVDLIYYGEEWCEVEMVLDNPITNESLKINRVFYSSKNKSSTLTCYTKKKGGEWSKVTTFPGVREGNGWILDRIGVGREDLINYFIVSSSKSVSFFSQSDNDKKAIVSRFSGTSPLLPIKDRIKQEIGEVEGEKLREGEVLTKLQGRLEGLEEQLSTKSKEREEELRGERVKVREEKVQGLKQQIEQLKRSIVDKKKHTEDKRVELQGLKQQEASLLPKQDYTQQIVKYSKEERVWGDRLLEEMKVLESKRQEWEEFREFKVEIEQNLHDGIVCPNCSHTFLLRDESYNLQEAKLQLPIVEQQMEELNTDITSQQQVIDLVKDNINNLSQQIQRVKQESRKWEEKQDSWKRKVRLLENEILSINSQIESVESKVLINKDSIVELENEIVSIKQEELGDGGDELRERIEEVKELIKNQLEVIEEVKERYIQKQELYTVFVKFITHLSNKAVKSIQLRTNQYLKAMGSDLSINIEGYKVNSDNSIREKFTTVVERDGIPVAFIENFSEGEKSRINIATTLALNSLLNLSCGNGKGLSLLIMDELMGSLDSLGVGLVMESLSQLNQTILAISHVEPRQYYNNTIVVVKENQCSYLKQK